MNEKILKNILENAIDLIVEHEAGDSRFANDEEFWKYFYDALGTSEMELKRLGIDMSDYM